MRYFAFCVAACGLVVPAAFADTTPPTAPTHFIQTGATLATIDFAWDPATDDVGVTEYRLYQFFKGRFPSLDRYTLLLDHLATTGTTLMVATSNSGVYAVAARDAAGNESPRSVHLTARAHSLPTCYGNYPNNTLGLFATVAEPLAQSVVIPSGNPLPAITLESGPAGLILDTAGGAAWLPTVGQETTTYPLSTPGVTVTARVTNVEGSALCNVTFPVWSLGTDHVYPSLVPNLHVTGAGPNTIALAWDPATDNVGIATYHVRAYHQCHYTAPPGCGHAVNIDLPGDQLAVELQNMRASTPYTISVWAIDPTGNFNSYYPFAVTWTTSSTGTPTTTTVPGTINTSTTLTTDADGDGIPDPADNCPLDWNPAQDDLDGDGLGNVCDDEDAALSGAKASLAAGVPGAAKGKIAVTSQFTTAPPGDVFDAAAGVTLQVASGDGANSLVAWSAADCSTATTGRIRCRSVDGAAIATFRPNASGGWKMTTVIGRLEFAEPLSGPIFVRVQHGAGVDRTAVLPLCTGSPTKVRCSLP